MDTTILIIILTGLAVLAYAGGMYALVRFTIVTVSRRAEREQARHEQAEAAHIERERELLQLILHLARARGREPVAWESDAMDEVLARATEMEDAARVRRDAEQLQPYGPDFDVQLER